MDDLAARMETEETNQAWIDAMERKEPMKLDIMIDIECLSTQYDAVVTQIGYCEFDLGYGDLQIGEPHTLFVNLDSSIKAGFRIEAKTLKWWMEQEDHFEAIFNKEAVPITRALGQLSAACQDVEHVWACPPQFDLSILKNAFFQACGGGMPWRHRSERCLRTLCDIAGYDRKSMGPYAEHRHNAGSDAFAQCKQAQAAFALLHPAGKDSV